MKLSVVAILLAVALVTGCGEIEPERRTVAVPDFQGPWVAALEAADEADLDLKPLHEGGMRQPIIDQDAWEVEAQSVAPGEQVEPGTEVEVDVIRTADRERQARLESEREEREAARLEREAEREEWRAAREAEREQRDAEREDERQQREAAGRERGRFDYDALVAEQWSSVVPYIDTIATTATTVTVRLNMGNADENGIEIAPDGLTDRGLAIELCEMMKRHGVHDAVDILDPRGLALARTGILDGQCKLT